MVKDVTPKLPNDEHQSMQALSQYGGYIVLAIVLALGGYFGWNYWQNHGGRIDEVASTDFAKIQASQQAVTNLGIATDDKAKAELATAQANFGKDLDAFIAQHGESVYTWQALMLKAKQQTDSGDIKGATTTLQQATTLKIDDEGLKAIATLRYAQALLGNQQADDAQKALQAVLPPAFDASKNELLGDVAMAKNDKKSAIDFYQKAWQAIEKRNESNELNQDRAFLRLKMENLGLTPKQPDLDNGVVATPNTAQAVATPTASTASVATVTASATN
ncbi:YfgM family protein [Faucicola boevrei]|uniref:YfgM family protein n=1 Tax=Faucicola boevrei TaxID=346665 RepID=UPI000372236E|nr:tetratricopeptide repeat protein [Moraxella boevrei]